MHTNTLPVALDNQIANAPNIDAPAQIRLPARRSVIPQLWPEWKQDEAYNIQASPTYKIVNFPVNVSLTRRKIYVYGFCYSTTSAVVFCKVNLRFNEQTLLALPLNLYGGGYNGAWPEGSTVSIPGAGGMQTPDSILFWPGGNLITGNGNSPATTTGEPVSLVLQPLFLDLVFNNISVDLTAQTGTIGVNTYFRVWVGCLSY